MGGIQTRDLHQCIRVTQMKWHPAMTFTMASSLHSHSQRSRESGVILTVGVEWEMQRKGYLLFLFLFFSTFFFFFSSTLKKKSFYRVPSQNYEKDVFFTNPCKPCFSKIMWGNFDNWQCKKRTIFFSFFLHKIVKRGKKKLQSLNLFKSCIPKILSIRIRLYIKLRYVYLSSTGNHGPIFIE